MPPSDKNILITGLPGVGKTTLIRNVCDKLSGINLAGFYTSEIREAGIRKGFELVDFNGERQLLSHVDIESQFRVGKYRVDIAGFEKYLDNSGLLTLTSQLVVIDEIGKMECLSPKFVTLVNELLASKKMVLATIALKGGGVIGEIRRRQDIQLFEITPRNRNLLASEILSAISGTQ
jgi:nucleoside-triphosphatase